MRITSDGKKYRSESELKELISRFECSDLTQTQFCESEGIGASSLHRWLRMYGSVSRRHRQEAKVKSLVNEFVSVGVSEAEPGSQYTIELELPHGIKLRLS
jgi:hypothetical protein